MHDSFDPPSLCCCRVVTGKRRGNTDVIGAVVCPKAASLLHGLTSTNRALEICSAIFGFASVHNTRVKTHPTAHILEFQAWYAG